MKRCSLLTVAVLALFAFSYRPAAAADQADIIDTAVSAGSFNTLAAALEAAGLIDALKADGPFTVFAPTDEAFARLPEGTVENLLKPENRAQLAAILTYHVVPGTVTAEQVAGLRGAVSLNGQRINILAADGKVTVDDAQVVKTDIACSNGVIHVIDSVMLPATDDIPTTAAGASQFKTLLAAVKAADLATVLAGDGPYTVFAPTDEAFAKLPAGTIESLLEPENREQLAAILKYHVVAGRVYSEQALKAGEAQTLEGRPIRIGVIDGKAMVNEAGLVATDIDASNGVIHVIDTVLLPPAAKEAAQAAPAAPPATRVIHVRRYSSSPCSGRTVRSYRAPAVRFVRVR